MDGLCIWRPVSSPPSHPVPSFPPCSHPRFTTPAVCRRLDLVVSAPLQVLNPNGPTIHLNSNIGFRLQPFQQFSDVQSLVNRRFILPHIKFAKMSNNAGVQQSVTQSCFGLQTDSGNLARRCLSGEGSFKFGFDAVLVSGM